MNVQYPVFGEISHNTMAHFQLAYYAAFACPLG